MNWKAKWIWLADTADLPNRYVHFRGAFEMPALKKGARAALHVTAGHYYRLYLNGEFLGRGPDRCYFRKKIYHTYDATPFLRKGKNVLALHVHYIGQGMKNLMERQAEGPAGCVAQLEIGSRPVFWTDARWKAIEDPAYSRNTEPPSMHREWRNEFYAAKAIAGWNTRGFDDSAWPAARVVAPADGGAWGKLIPKETAEMTAEPLAPLNLYATNDGGHQSSEYDHFRIYNMISEVPERLPGPFTVWNDRHERQEFLFDMGRVVAGYPRIEIGDSTGGTIEVYYGDSLSLGLWDTVHMGNGPLTWSPFTTRGGRYFKLVVRGARNPVAIRSVRWIRTNYPVAWRGSFESSDPKLAAIWKMCALSAETCGLEHIVDCVGREQVLWMMDFRFQAMQHYYCFGDTALARKCFRQFAFLQLDNGHILCYGPSCRPKELLGPGDVWDWLNFNFYFMLAVREHFEYSQDRALLREMYPTCKRAMDYYARSERDGFATCGEVRGSNHIDWGYQGYQESGDALYSFTQGVYYGALKALSGMAALLGKKAEAQAATRRAADLERRFFQTFVDPRTNRVADGIMGGKRFDCNTGHPSISTLRFFDRIPEAVRARSLEVVVARKVKLPRSGIGIALGAEALFRQGQGAAAVALIRDYYGAILDAGLTQVPEFYDLEARRGADCRWAPGYSRCHSYASLGGTLLQKYVLGAQVEGSTVRLSPRFSGLDRASGVVPTPAGDVRIEWTRQPEGAQVTVRAPEAVKVQFEPADEKEKVTVTIKRA